MSEARCHIILMRGVPIFADSLLLAMLRFQARPQRSWERPA